MKKCYHVPNMNWNQNHIYNLGRLNGYIALMNVIEIGTFKTVDEMKDYIMYQIEFLEHTTGNGIVANTRHSDDIRNEKVFK